MIDTINLSSKDENEVKKTPKKWRLYKSNLSYLQAKYKLGLKVSKDTKDIVLIRITDSHYSHVIRTPDSHY